MLQERFYFTYLSPLGKKPRKQYHRWFYTRGLKLCYRCSFRGEWERTCVVELSDEGSRNDGSITQQSLAVYDDEQKKEASPVTILPSLSRGSHV